MRSPRKTLTRVTPTPLAAACLIASTLIGVGTPAHAADPAAVAESPPDAVFSKSLRFTGNVVAVLPSGKTIRDTAVHDGRVFKWRAKLGPRRAAPETVSSAPAAAQDLDAVSVEQLAQDLRGLALFNGHEFIEAEPAFDAARLAKLHHQRQREGASADELAQLLPGVKPSSGSLPRTPRSVAEIGARHGSVVPQSVHGTDDRVVMTNTSYPHSVQIVFDNAGSTSAIEASQGSGTLIGRSTAMSVAHVFWDETNDTWEATHRWAPGYDSQDADKSPFGDWTGCYWVTIPLAYTNNVNQNTYDYAVVDFDSGCNSVDNGVNSDEPGSTVGWIGAYVASSGDIQGRSGNVRGYPGTGICGSAGGQCNVRVWGDSSSSSENNATANEIRHQADTSGGMSGSGFYHYTDPTCSGCGYGAYLVGMHRAGSTSYNIARRYDSSVSSFMHANSSEY